MNDSIKIPNDITGKYSREIYIRNNFPEFYNMIINKYPKDIKWSEKLYWYIHNISSHPMCPICNTPVKFIDLNHGYHNYCSCKCVHQDAIVRKKYHNTLKERYGDENYNNREKLKQTCLERYGVDNPAKLQSSKDKSKQTCLDRYGVEYASQNKSIKEKIKRANFDKYGTETPQQLESYKQSIKKTKYERYGDENYNNRNKSKQTCLERYGVDNIMKSKEIQKEIQDKNRRSNIDRISELIGYTDNGDWICRCPHPGACDKCLKKYYISPYEIHYDRIKSNAELCTRLLPIQSLFSTYELQVRSWLDELNIKYISNDRSILGDRELDIYIPGSRLAIEINGCYWHSNACKSKSYHIDKWIQCKGKKIKMITLWEDWIQDHPDECKQLIMYHLGLMDDINVPWDHNLVDLGLRDGNTIKEHLSIHNGFECWDCGLFV